MSDEYTISSDPERLDREWIHKVISTDTYWGVGRSRDRMDQAIDHSTASTTARAGSSPSPG
jgi:hypothetical protein